MSCVLCLVSWASYLHVSIAWHHSKRLRLRAFEPPCGLKLYTVYTVYTVYKVYKVGAIIGFCQMRSDFDADKGIKGQRATELELTAHPGKGNTQHRAITRSPYPPLKHTHTHSSPPWLCSLLPKQWPTG